MRVLVMAAVAENEKDLQIVIVADTAPDTQVSSVITLEGEANSYTGNPYLVYGAAIEEFTGCDKYQCSISVFECCSGNLDGWF